MFLNNSNFFFIMSQKLELVKLIQDFIETWFYHYRNTKEFNIYCAEVNNMFIIHVRKTPIPTNVNVVNVKQIYFDEGFEIRINKNHVIEKSCREIEEKLNLNK